MQTIGNDRRWLVGLGHGRSAKKKASSRKRKDPQGRAGEQMSFVQSWPRPNSICVLTAPMKTP